MPKQSLKKHLVNYILIHIFFAVNSSVQSSFPPPRYNCCTVYAYLRIELLYSVEATLRIQLPYRTIDVMVFAGYSYPKLPTLFLTSYIIAAILWYDVALVTAFSIGIKYSFKHSRSFARSHTPLAFTDIVPLLAKYVPNHHDTDSKALNIKMLSL